MVLQMLLYTWSFFFIYSILPAIISANECYVTPCTRDIIIVVDGSSSMQTSTYVSQEINMITKLTYSWTLDESKVRLALVGAYFGNEFNGLDYFTDSSLVEKRLQSFRLAAMQYGLFSGNFNTTVRFLDERYVGKRANFGPRINVQKRIVIFSSHSGTSDISSTKNTLEQFSQQGYEVTIVGIGVDESVYKGTYYHKFVSVQWFELGVVAQSIIDTITEEGICFLDKGWTTPKPQTCTTTTTTTTTRAPTTTTAKGVTAKTVTSKPTTSPKPVPPTHPPFPVGDYQECSCTTQSLYIDIVFVVDTSAGMGLGGLMMVKAEINTLTVFKPSDYDNEDEFTEDLWTDPRLEDVDETIDEVNLHAGLQQAAKMLGSMRNGVKKVVVVYAASYNDEGNDDPRQIAANIRGSGHKIITVAFVEPESSSLVLKMAEIASPRMNFTSYRDDLLVEELEDAFCQVRKKEFILFLFHKFQVNCYCPRGWRQLTLENRTYGECFFPTKIDASWTATKYECPILSKEHTGNGHLVYVNSALKNTFLNNFYMENWDKENQEKPNYDIGYYYDKTTQKYIWVNGVTNNPYANWAENHPDLSKGECVMAKQVEGTTTDFKWISINCQVDSGRGLCQEAACDSDFYCPPEN
ncbi:CBN-CLEC-160 protein [Caenorhabditis brenneri]|uniref:CBN-CLEC-160 protein n=1 Tax=Caenorhabditis brenneri TaxID=135651 RepID=G0N5I3_CAEBE|nr:CBN-CLEC-160 protein [Caenorhabditis brenneri]